MKNKYLLKTEFCKKYNITTKTFNNVLLYNGYLTTNEYGKLTKDFKNSYITKVKLSPTLKGEKYIIKKSGSWAQGIFKFNDEYFKQYFNV